MDRSSEPAVSQQAALPSSGVAERRKSLHGAVMPLLIAGVAALLCGCGSSSSATGSTQAAAVSKPSRAVASHSDGWSAPVTLFRGEGALLPAISCASARLCVAVGAKGSSGVGLSDAMAWSSPVVIDKAGGLAGVSCAPGSSCVAVGASALLGLRGVTYRFLGGKWSAGPTSRFDLAALSCPTASFCAAVDNLTPRAHGFVFNGKRWSPPSSIGVPADSISCPTATFCVAASPETGKVVYYKHGTWSKATLIDRSDSNPTSVSCASASFCVAVDGNGDALSYVNGRWSKPARVDPSSGLSSVSCPTTRFCAAVGSDEALTYDGSSWSSPRTISGQFEFTSVSCPTASFCAAVGQASPFINGAPAAAYAATYDSLP